MRNATLHFQYRYMLLHCQKEIGECLQSQGLSHYKVSIDSSGDQENDGPKQYRVMKKQVNSTPISPRQTEITSPRKAPVPSPTGSAVITPRQILNTARKAGWVNSSTSYSATMSPRQKEITSPRKTPVASPPRSGVTTPTPRQIMSTAFKAGWVNILSPRMSEICERYGNANTQNGGNGDHS